MLLLFSIPCTSRWLDGELATNPYTDASEEVSHKATLLRYVRVFLFQTIGDRKIFKFGFIGLTEENRIGKGDYSSVTLHVPPSLTREGSRCLFLAT